LGSDNNLSDADKKKELVHGRPTSCSCGLVVEEKNNLWKTFVIIRAYLPG